MREKKKKRRLKFSGVLLILFIVILIGVSSYFVINAPIRKINIEGNNYLKDNYVIDYLDINESLFKLSKKKLKNKLLELDLVKSAKISKNLFGTLTIRIEEDRILFYNYNKNKIILSTGREIDYNNTYLGVPTLINYVPDDVYSELIKKMVKVNAETISKISEIEYSPSLVGDKIIDDKRFLFRMNDGNKVYINTVNIEKINNYLEIYDLIVNKNGLVKGCLYLDSNSDNKYFNDCEEEKIIDNDTNGDV